MRNSKLLLITSGALMSIALVAPTNNIAEAITFPSSEVGSNVVTESAITAGNTASSSEELYKFMADSKLVAKENWYIKLKVTSTKRADNELKKQIKLTKKQQAIQAQKLKVRAAAIKKAQSSIRESENAANRLAKEIDRRRKKQEKAKRQSSLGKGTVYIVGSGGKSEVKTWMPHTKSNGGSIFLHASAQYALQKQAYTGSHGIRMVGGRYCIAVGSRFTSKIGTKIDVVLENGNVLRCIVGDQKSDLHTDSTHSYHRADGSWVEFIVNRNVLDHAAQTSGNISSISGFGGPIEKMIVY